MMNTIKSCIHGGLLALVLVPLHGLAESGDAAPMPQSMCILLGMLGVTSTSDECEEQEDAADPTSPQAPAADACPGHPGVRPRPGFSKMEFVAERGVWVVTTPETTFEPSSALDNLPKNLCPTVYENARSHSGAEIPHTLPSTPDEPYNLHPKPTMEPIDPRSPSDDLKAVLDSLRQSVANGELPNAADIQFALDILEGNPIDRAYSGMPLLHYNGPNKVEKVKAVYENGVKVGGRVELHQVWFDGRIMSDTAFIDPSDVRDVPWTMVVHADTLNNGHEDFAPFQMYFDDPDEIRSPSGGPLPHVAMDMTFFPMEDGTRTTYELKMAPGRFFNLTYYWGWRIHPPRVQVTENALKMAGMGENRRSLVEWEEFVFGEDPQAGEEAKLAAISMIGDLAPAKRMWNLMRELRDAPNLVDEEAVEAFADAFYDWKDRLSLPSGIEYDDDFDVNIVYLNNTIYGQARGQGNWEQSVDFDKPGDVVRVKVLNGDYFPHAYMFVDFGGNRGWENTFHSTIEHGGAGPWFTFGRTHWWPMLNPAPLVPAATPAEGVAKVKTIDSAMQWTMLGAQSVARAGSGSLPGKSAGGIYPDWLNFSESPSILKEFQRTQDINGSTLGVLPLEFHMNHTPSKRLRMYQFDPLHHDVAVWSIH
ncbi:MAG: hypothetical protein RQ847_06605 [Wenzhouxiangellaceae bacterium]|nr:hypothetical protein [Wenzhouxiangellaceae bacterium]